MKKIDFIDTVINAITDIFDRFNKGHKLTKSELKIMRLVIGRGQRIDWPKKKFDKDKK